MGRSKIGVVLWLWYSKGRRGRRIRHIENTLGTSTSGPQLSLESVENDTSRVFYISAKVTHGADIKWESVWERLTHEAMASDLHASMSRHSTGIPKQMCESLNLCVRTNDSTYKTHDAKEELHLRFSRSTFLLYCKCKFLLRIIERAVLFSKRRPLVSLTTNDLVEL